MSVLLALRFTADRPEPERCTIDTARLRDLLSRDPATPTVHLLEHEDLTALLAAAAAADRPLEDRETQNTTDTPDGPQTTRLVQTLGPATRHAAQRLAYSQPRRIENGVRRFLDWLRRERRSRALWYFVSTDPVLWKSVAEHATPLSREEGRRRALESRYAGRSPAASDVRARILQAAQAPLKVVIMVRGESGTGKEIVARAIHDCSDRKDRPFVAFNCAAIAPTLANDELFGHERGAFTGATGRRTGLFEEANRGTIFLDEIGDMSPDVQAMVLRTVQDRVVRRLGGFEWIPIDVRIIVATHRNLDAMVRRGEFRADLFHRLNGLSIDTPPLREHPEDLEVHVARVWQAELQRPPLPPAAMEILRAWDWPGNVRELETTLHTLDVEVGTDPVSDASVSEILRRRLRSRPSGAIAGTALAGEGEPGPAVRDDHVARFREARPHYLHLERTLRTLAERLLRSPAPFATVSSWTMTVGEVAERLEREGRGEDPLRTWRDLCGVRVVLYTQQDKQAFAADLWRYCEVADDVRVPARDVDLGASGFHPLGYAVSLRAEDFPTLARTLRLDVPPEVVGLWGCVRLRTVLEEVGLTVREQVVPPGATLPESWEKELGTLETVVAKAQRELGRIYGNVRTWAGSYGVHRNETEARRELATLEAVLARVPDDATVAARAGKLAMILGDWERAVAIFEPHADAAYPPLLRDLGVVLCKRHEVGSVAHQRGLRLLDDACRMRPDDPDAFASRAGALKRAGQIERARDSYRGATEIDGADPYALGGLLETSLVLAPDADVIGGLQSQIDRAIQRCRDRIAAGVDLPWSSFDLGKFLGLRGELEESSAAYADGIEQATAAFMLETTLRSVETLLEHPSVPAEMVMARRMLAVGWCARFPSEAARRRLAAAAPVRSDLRPPAVVVREAAVDAPANADGLMLRQVLAEGLRGFAGTIAIVGDCGWAAEAVRGVAAESFPDAQLVEYPAGSQSYPTLGAWQDLVASAVPASATTVLLLGGDEVAWETDGRLAGCFGGRSAVVPMSGDGVEGLLPEDAVIGNGRDLAAAVAKEKP